MKRTLTVLLVAVLLIAGLFVLTACGNGETNGEGGGNSKIKTVEISHKTSMYEIKTSVPVKTGDDGQEVPAYEFVEDVPEAVKDFFYGGGTFLVGDKVVAGVETESYTYQTGRDYKEKYGEVTPSFESFKEFVYSEGSSSTLKQSELVKIGDREAMKAEVRVGSGSGDLYGYRYVINIDDVYPRGYMEITFLRPDGEKEGVEETFADAEVQTIINSIVISAVAE